MSEEYIANKNIINEDTKMKKDIRNSVNPEQAKQLVLTMIVVAMVAVVAFQSLELMQLRGYANKGGQIQTVQAARAAAPISAATAQARPTRNPLPSQVGGC